MVEFGFWNADAVGEAKHGVKINVGIEGLNLLDKFFGAANRKASGCFGSFELVDIVAWQNMNGVRLGIKAFFAHQMRATAFFKDKNFMKVGVNVWFPKIIILVNSSPPK